MEEEEELEEEGRAEDVDVVDAEDVFDDTGSIKPVAESTSRGNDFTDASPSRLNLFSQSCH